jgi:hypothetical protein
VKRFSYTSLAVVSVLALASCGSSSKVSEKDAAGCKELAVNATGTINDISAWMRQQPSTEGTRAGYEAAMEVANTMADTSLKAKDLSSKASSKETKKIYDAIEVSFREAALAIASRGGSFESGEMELLKKAVGTAEDMSKFCGIE